MTAFCLIFSPVIITEMCVNIGSVGFFNATELIYAVYKANKGGFDSLNELYVQKLILKFLVRTCLLPISKV